MLGSALSHKSKVVILFVGNAAALPSMMKGCQLLRIGDVRIDVCVLLGQGLGLAVGQCGVSSKSEKALVCRN
jgi:hypothetical protein